MIYLFFFIENPEVCRTPFLRTPYNRTKDDQALGGSITVLYFIRTG